MSFFQGLEGLFCEFKQHPEMALIEHSVGLLKALVDLVFPRVCVVCLEALKISPEDPHGLLSWRGYGICSSCAKDISWLVPPFCPSCALPIHSPAVSSHVCPECTEDPPPFCSARALVVYDQEVSPLLHKMKYGPDASLARFMGEILVSNLRKELEALETDLVVPIPLHVARLRHRGFNQAAIMGKAVARTLGVPFHLGVLDRSKATPPQVGLSRIQRRDNIKGAFFVRDPSLLKRKTILLVDDVYTTGATFREAARELLKKGAARVHVLAFARVL